MNPILLAAGWQPLIPFILAIGFFCLSLLHAAWKKNQRRGPTGPRHDPPPLQASESSRRFDPPPPVRHVHRHEAESEDEGPPISRPARLPSPWEMELERMLHGDPLVLAAPLPRTPPPEIKSWEPYQFPGLPPVLAAISVSESTDLESAPAPSTPLASLASASASVERGTTLLERVHGRMQSVNTQVVHAAPTRATIRAATLDPGVAAMVRNLGKPATARQALVASIIMAPPKAFE